MSDIDVRFEHRLGLAEARRIAALWVQQAQTQWGLHCESQPGEAGDTIAFSRSGVRGDLQLSAEHFALKADLGFLLKGFRQRIQTEIQTSLAALATSAPEGRSDKPA